MQLAFSVAEVQALTGLGRTKVYELLGTGELPAKKHGRRTVILKADLEKFLASLKDYNSQKKEV